MHFFDQRVARLAQDFKTRTWESIQDHKITQDDIGAALGVDQCTVSRWMSVAGDLHFPACMIPALADEKVVPLREDIVRMLVEKSGYVLGRRVRIMTLNGTVADEAVELVAHLGKFAEQVSSGHMDPRKAKLSISHMRAVLDRAEAELESKNAAG